MRHMEENNLFTKHQHGFRKGYSCVTQLINVCEKWTEELDNKNNIDVVYLDFVKPSTPPPQNIVEQIKRIWHSRKTTQMDREFFEGQKSEGTS